jgi:hypothetical protein
MAEINVQRRKSRSIWPWIVGVAVLALVVWGVTRMGGDNTPERALYDDTTLQTLPAAETWDTTAAGVGTDTITTGPMMPAEPSARDAASGGTPPRN